ncbi:MAG: MG2 domain-containing protein, partial [Thermodesulfobacteriota bacterium]
MRRLPVVLLFFAFAYLISISHVYAVFDSATANANKSALKIIRITPDGKDVPAERQIVFTFNRPVVPVGRMERDSSEIPIIIKPALKCEWRWLNTTSLACQLGDKTKMTRSTEYTVTIEPGIKTEDGSTLSKPQSHSFITERAKVRYSYFDRWTSPVMPRLQVYFNQPVTIESVERHLYFLVMKHPHVRGPEDKRVAVTFVPRNDKERGKLVLSSMILTPSEDLGTGSVIWLRAEPGVISEGGSAPSVDSRTIVKFATFDEFKFLGLSCEGSDGTLVGKLSTGETTPENSRCNPLRDLRLNFSAPLNMDTVKKSLAFDPGFLRGAEEGVSPWSGVYNRFYIRGSHSYGKKYSVQIPKLKPYKDYKVSAPAAEIRDLFGRTLVEDLDFAFETAHLRPDYALSSRFFVLEKGVDTEVGLGVDNLDTITLDYETITHEGKQSGKKDITPGLPIDVGAKISLKTKELIPAESGLIKARLTTSPLVAKSNNNNWFFSEVTPFSVHAKLGHFNTTVWVTDFATGLPVPGAKVSIYIEPLLSLSASPSVLSRAITGEGGTAVLDGSEQLNPERRISTYDSRGWGDTQKNILVRVEKDGDIALLPLTRAFQVEAKDSTGRYLPLWMKKRFEHIKTWGTTPQGVYKAGDEIQYKIYVRNQDNERFVPAPKDGYTLEVKDPTGKVVHTVKDITLSEFGAFDGEFTVSKTGAVGWYNFNLSAVFSKNSSRPWRPMKVLVSDFTPAPFRVTTDINGTLFRPGDKVVIDTSARLHAGGPYADADARVATVITRSALTATDAVAKGFHFQVFSYTRGAVTINSTSAKVDDKGDLRTEFIIGDPRVLYGRMMAESSVRDDRGKYVAGRTAATYAGRDRYVGVKQKDWLLEEGKPAAVEAVVIDEHGRVVTDVKIKIKAEFRKSVASKVKGAGNAYITRYSHEWVSVDSCEVRSAAEPVSCTFTPEKSGSYRYKASIVDTLNRAHTSTISRWAIGGGYVL